MADSNPTITVKLVDGTSATTGGGGTGGASGGVGGGGSASTTPGITAAPNMPGTANKVVGAPGLRWPQQAPQALPPPLPPQAQIMPTFAEGAIQGLGGGGMMNQLNAIKAQGGIGSAAGAIGIIAGVAVAAQAVTSSLNMMTGQVNRVSGVLTGLAGNKLPSGSEIPNAMAEAVGNIPILGDMVAAQIKMTDAVVQLPAKLTGAFIERSKELAPYSGAISAAQAGADVRAIQGDIREAQELGPGMARMVDAESRLEHTVRELMLPIKRVVVDLLAERLELMVSALQTIANSKAAEKAEQGYNGITGVISGMSAGVQLFLKKILGEVEKQNKKDKEDPDQLYNDFFGDAFFGARPIGAPKRPPFVLPS